MFNVHCCRIVLCGKWLKSNVQKQPSDTVKIELNQNTKLLTIIRNKIYLTLNSLNKNKNSTQYVQNAVYNKMTLHWVSQNITVCICYFHSM